MNKRWIGVVVGLLLVTLLVVSSPIAFSQSEPTPLVYTFVSQFEVPRANWAQYAGDTERSFVPVAEKMTADGTILSWVTFEQVVHQPGGYTHGAAWTSTTISGLMKVLDEIRKAGPQPGQVAATKHEDYLMQTTTYRVGSGTPAYLRVVCSNTKPDKPGAFTATMKKLLVPTFEEEVKKGVATYYGIDEQYVNTSAQSTRCVVIDYPSAEAMDKWATAINTTLAKWSPAERAEFDGSTVPDSRHDLLARVTHSGHK